MEEFTLEEMLETELDLCRVREDNKTTIKHLLALLKICDEPTYEHSIRVGILASKIARFMHLDPKPLIFQATHDAGKLMSDPESLKKTKDFNEKNMKKMRRHVTDGARLLRGLGFYYTAAVEEGHHSHQEKPYPYRLSKTEIPFSRGTKLMIYFNQRLTALADFYDAATTRVNNKFGDMRRLSPEEVKVLMLLKNPDQRYLIEELYKNQILGEEKQERTVTQDQLYNALWKDYNGLRTPEETRRHVTLACALEPLSDKPGCTTRSTNASRHLKLEYFLASAINIGDSFEELASRIKEQKNQPSVIYDLAYKAQQQCQMNRDGGRINSGTLELLMPIIAAQHLFDKDHSLSIEQTLSNAVKVLKQTSRDDIGQLRRMKNLAYQLCGDKYKDRVVPTYPDAENVFDYYKNELKNSTNPTSIAHNSEFCRNFPATRLICNVLEQSKEFSFERKVEAAYRKARGELHKGVGYGMTADCIAAGIYLTLSHHPTEKIIV